MQRHVKMTVGALLLGIFLVCSAQSVRAVMTFIQKSTVEGVEYASGGVGEEERKALEAIAGDYSLKLVFATSEGHYMADVMIAIEDHAGDLKAHTQSKGPWFYINLPTGQYKVTVAFDDQVKTANVKVGGGLKTVRFFFKEIP